MAYLLPELAGKKESFYPTLLRLPIKEVEQRILSNKQPSVGIHF